MADYGSVLRHPFEKTENPQAYDETPYAFVSPQPMRHVLGVVGGNEVSGIQGNRVDLESDLLGITRPNTWSTDRKHLPPKKNDTVVHRENPKNSFQVNVAPKHFPAYQMFAIPATFAPLPLEKQTCGRPEKY
jgi:hypothetical protein